VTQPGGTVRSVKTKLEADVGNYKRALVDATGVTTKLGDEVNRVGGLAKQKAAEQAAAANQQRQAFERQMQAADRLGRGMLIAGAAIAAGIGLAARAAIQWESAWAGVAKTVNGSDQELAALEEDLRELARTLPATHQEIAAVAEAAGQLGVATEDIANFTEVMIGLGEATNLTADEAATSIAQLMNVMGTAPDEVDNLASALVELGNNGASTERDIIQMAQRIAGAGSIVGASEADVLALANALSSAGIEAEAGGSAISRVMVDMATSVNEGGEKLDLFAQVAGKSSDEFASAWRSDPVAALNLFVQGLGRMNAAGGDVFGTLEQLSLSEVRTRDALLRLSSAGDLLTSSLDDGARAWEENTALLEEVERRYGTTESKIAVARNQLNDFAIDIGSKLLPALGEIVQTIGFVADLFGDLPGPIQAVLGVLGAVSAAILLAGGAALVAVPRVVAFKQALDTIVASGGRAAVAVGAFRASTGAVAGFLTGPWGIALALGVATLGAYAHEQSKAKQHTDDLAGAIDQQTGAITANAKMLVAQALAAKEWTFNAGSGRGVTLEFTDALNTMNVELATAVEAATGNESALRGLEERLAAAKVAYEAGVDITGQFADGTDEAREASLNNYHMMQLIIEAVTAEGDAVQGAADKVRLFAEATGQGTDEMSELDPQARTTAEGLGITAQAADDLTEAAEALGNELDAVFNSLFGVEEAQDAAAEAMARLVEHAAEEGAALAGNSEAALQNRDNVRGLIDADYDLIAAMAEAGAGADELAEESQRLKDAFIEQMRQAGFSEEAIEDYADAYDEIPSRVRTLIQADPAGALAAMREVQRGLYRLDGSTATVYIRANADAAVPFRGLTAERWGGVVKAQIGKLIPAHITRSPTVMYGERATGMEAYIPMYGSRSRSLAIADTAARWHGGRVMPAGMAEAARELLGHVKSGGKVFEDLSFRGMSANLGRFNDQLASRYYGQGGRDLGRFLASMGNQWRGQRTSSGGAASGEQGGRFEGALYLDSGVFLGVVRGEVRQVQDAHDRNLLRDVRQGVGATI
jgi:TP901 family phage tail tape measure protein